MAPPTTFIALLIVLALVPGWFYLRLIEPLEPPRSSTSLHQLLEVLAVGAATTGVSVLVLILVPHSWLPFTLDVEKWASSGNKYLKLHLRDTAFSSGLLLVGSLAIAFGLAKARAHQRSAEFHHSTTWVQSLGARPPGKLPYVGLHLTDGRLVEGVLHAFDLDTDESPRDIALARPIRITPTDGQQAFDFPNLDRLIVDESRIDYISVHHAPSVGHQTPRRSRFTFRL